MSHLKGTVAKWLPVHDSIPGKGNRLFSAPKRPHRL